MKNLSEIVQELSGLLPAVKAAIGEILQVLPDVFESRRVNGQTNEPVKLLLEYFRGLDGDLATCEGQAGNLANECASALESVDLGAALGRCSSIKAVLAGFGKIAPDVVSKLEQLNIARDGLLSAQEKARECLALLADCEATLHGVKAGVHNVEAALEDCKRLEALLARDRKLIEDASAELHALKHGADLADKATVTRFCELLAIKAVGNECRANQLSEFDDARQGLVNVCNNFVASALAPRFRNLREQAIRKVSAELSPAFKGNTAALTAAAASSSLVAELAPVEAGVTRNLHQIDDWRRLAERTLAAWRAADQFEKTHLA